MSKKTSNDNSSLKNYGRFSGLAFQMFGMLALSVGAGIALDKYFTFKIPVFTIVFTVISFIGVMIWLIRNVSQD